MTQEQKDLLHSKGFNRHHWSPRSRNGGDIQRNISWLNEEKHRAWHRMFFNLTLKEVIIALDTVGEMIMSQKKRDWHLVFKDRNVYQAKLLLQRMRRIKKGQSCDPA